MKKLVLMIFCISILLFSNLIFSQESKLNTEIKKLLAKELFLVNEFWGGRIVINKLNFDITDTNFVRINQITKLWGGHSPYSGYDILKVNVSFINLTVAKKEVNYLDSISFNYIIISNSPYELYKLLGFTNTDINKTQYTFYPYKNNKDFLKWIVQVLIQNKYLTNKEGRYMLKSLIKEKHTYNKKINQPVNLINIIYPKYLQQSLILPYYLFSIFRV
jgi:hypothetical protein